MPRQLSPSEYTALRTELKVGPGNESKYFIRDNKGNILIKDEFDPRVADSGSLENTLPAESELPGQVDDLTALKIMLKESTNLAIKRGLVSGTQGALEGLAGMNITPEKISGGSFASIINMVEQNTVPAIKSEYEQMAMIIEGIAQRRDQAKADELNARTEARDQISQMISSGMWNKMEDPQRVALWQAAGYAGDPTIMQKTSFYHTEDADGNVWNITYDSETGEVVRKENLGPIGTPSSSGTQSLEEKELEKQEKLVKEFKDDLMDPKKVGIDRRIATKGEDQTDSQTYISREEFLNKLIAKWGDQIEPEDIKRALYETYPDRSQAEI